MGTVHQRADELAQDVQNVGHNLEHIGVGLGRDIFAAQAAISRAVQSSREEMVQEFTRNRTQMASGSQDVSSKLEEMRHTMQEILVSLTMSTNKYGFLMFHAASSTN